MTTTSRKAFLLAYDLKHSVQTKDGKTATLADWPGRLSVLDSDRPEGRHVEFRRGGRAARLLARRIGTDEQRGDPETCLAYVDAQNEYAAVTKVGGLSVYAQRLVSTPGQPERLVLANLQAPSNEVRSVPRSLWPRWQATALAVASRFNGYLLSRF